ncbi:ethanolamine utilization protein EutQ (cupin superfamily) [Phyllobacterium sp. 1468]|nr:ethanolamine utilization protein EutQ (cupin superfamily) [Phyllobacterium sp. 1468]
MAVDDIMVVLEGRLAVTTDDSTVTDGPGKIYSLKGTPLPFTPTSRAAPERLEYRKDKKVRASGGCFIDVPGGIVAAIRQ